MQLAMGHATPVGYWPDAIDETRTLVDSALGCTDAVLSGVVSSVSAAQGGCASGS